MLDYGPNDIFMNRFPDFLFLMPSHYLLFRNSSLGTKGIPMLRILSADLQPAEELALAQGTARAEEARRRVRARARLRPRYPQGNRGGE